MRVLAIQLKRIGDLALTTPALRALKSGGHHITLTVTEGSAALLPMMTDFVDETLVYKARGGSNRSLWQRFWREQFDACVDFTGRERSALMTLLARARVRVTANSLLRGGGWRRLCYNAVAEAPVRSRHTIDHYLDFLRPLGMSADPKDFADRPILSLPADVSAQANALLASTESATRSRLSWSIPAARGRKNTGCRNAGRR